MSNSTSRSRSNSFFHVTWGKLRKFLRSRKEDNEVHPVVDTSTERVAPPLSNLYDSHDSSFQDDKKRKSWFQRFQKFADEYQAFLSATGNKLRKSGEYLRNSAFGKKTAQEELSHKRHGNRLRVFNKIVGDEWEALFGRPGGRAVARGEEEKHAEENSEKELGRAKESGGKTGGSEGHGADSVNPKNDIITTPTTSTEANTKSGTDEADTDVYQLPNLVNGPQLPQSHGQLGMDIESNTDEARRSETGLETSADQARRSETGLETSADQARRGEMGTETSREGARGRETGMETSAQGEKHGSGVSAGGSHKSATPHNMALEKGHNKYNKNRHEAGKSTTTASDVEEDSLLPGSTKGNCSAESDRLPNSHGKDGIGKGKDQLSSLGSRHGNKHHDGDHEEPWKFHADNKYSAGGGLGPSSPSKERSKDNPKWYSAGGTPQAAFSKYEWMPDTPTSPQKESKGNIPPHAVQKRFPTVYAAPKNTTFDLTHMPHHAQERAHRETYIAARVRDDTDLLVLSEQGDTLSKLSSIAEQKEEKAGRELKHAPNAAHDHESFSRTVRTADPLVMAQSISVQGLELKARSIPNRG